MKRSEEHIIATRAALHLLGKIPPGYRWSLSVTDEDDHASPSTLNIYVPEPDWRYVARKLELKWNTELDKSPGYMSWRASNTLLVSILDEDQS